MGGGEGSRSGSWFRHWCLQLREKNIALGVSGQGREHCAGELVPNGQPVLDRGSLARKKSPGPMILVPSDYGSALPECGGSSPHACQLHAILLWMHNGLDYIYGQYRVTRVGRPAKANRRGFAV